MSSLTDPPPVERLAGVSWRLTSMPARNPNLTLIRRLQAIDAALASPDGVHLTTAAAEHGVSPKTIARDLALLRELGHEHEQWRERGDGPGNHGGWHVHRYVGPGRLFASND